MSEILSQEVIDKFWKFVEKTDNCWNWAGPKGKNGSPIIRFWYPWKEYSARRVSLQILKNKFLDKNERVQPLICKNKFCVNPDHLICGDEERFWNSVQKLSGDDACWVWTKHMDKDMYGLFHIHEKGKIIHLRAAAYSWQLYTGRPVPKNLLVCHSCDHPYCVNPQHLFLGTNKDNMEDMTNKNRQYRPKGKLNVNAKLTDDDIREIRKLKPTTTIKDLAKKFKVSPSTIVGIYTKTTWTHVN